MPTMGYPSPWSKGNAKRFSSGLLSVLTLQIPFSEKGSEAALVFGALFDVMAEKFVNGMLVALDCHTSPTVEDDVRPMVDMPNYY